MIPYFILYLIPYDNPSQRQLQALSSAPGLSLVLCLLHDLRHDMCPPKDTQQTIKQPHLSYMTSCNRLKATHWHFLKLSPQLATKSAPRNNTLLKATLKQFLAAFLYLRVVSVADATFRAICIVPKEPHILSMAEFRSLIRITVPV